MNSNKYSIAWTDEHIAILREMWAVGEPSRKIASRLGRGRNSVIGKAHRLSLAGRAGERPGRPAKPKAHRRAAPRLLAMPKVVKVLLPPPEPPVTLMLSLLELRPTMCRFPMGPAIGEKQLFCASPTPDHMHTYCRWHHKISFYAYKPKRDMARLAA